MGLLARDYNSLYTWDMPHDKHVLLHTDGACSCLIAWDGSDADLLTNEQRAAHWDKFYNILVRLAPGLCVEFHAWREYDDAPARRYKEHSKQLQRGGVFAARVRAEIAAHYGPRGISNQVGVVLTLQPTLRFAFSAKKKLNNETDNVRTLLRAAVEFLDTLDGARLASVDEYITRIRQSYDRRRYLLSPTAKYDPAYAVYEQVIPERPNVQGRLLDLAGHCTKVLLIYKYPDKHEIDAGWAIDLLATRCAMHVMSAVITTDTRTALKAAAKIGATADSLAQDDKGQDYQLRKSDQLGEFRKWVTNKNARIVRNLYVVHFHGTEAEVTAAAAETIRKIETFDGEVRDADYIQRYYFRVAQPGQAYLADMFRPDSHYLVANMLPVQVWSDGDGGRPEVLRQDHSGQLVTFSYTDKALLHAFHGGMSRSGKDAQHGAEVAELYGLGIDYSFLEIAPSYKWLCEAYAGPGSYVTLDPDRSVVNPLPLYENAAVGEATPLNTYMCSETVNALAFLLTGKAELEQHEKASAQSALQLLYLQAKPGKVAPNLEDFLLVLDSLPPDYHSVPMIEAAKQMAGNLSSFLSTSEGNLFTRDENVSFRPGMVGVDLKEVFNASKQLALFNVIFMALRFTQMAFSSRRFNMIVLNELFALVQLAPNVIKALCSSISRMGAKERSYLTIITQDTSEVDVLDPGILAQMPRRELLYRSGQWEHVAERLNISKERQAVVDRWRTFPYPVDLPYRESIHGYGDHFHHLHLTFPNFTLNLNDSSPDGLTLKQEIEKQYTDPIKRIEEIGKLIGRPI
jgi:hypothetical protein